MVYDGILEIEKQKYRILKRYLDNKEMQNTMSFRNQISIAMCSTFNKNIVLFL